MTSALLMLALAGPVNTFPVSGVPMSFEPIIDRYCHAYKVPKWLAMNVAEAESSFRPLVHSGSSRGLFQINARYETWLADQSGVKQFDWRNPDQSARVGIAYLSALTTRYHGNLLLTLASYNFGPANVASGKPWPKETIDYVRRVLK